MDDTIISRTIRKDKHATNVVLNTEGMSIGNYFLDSWTHHLLEQTAQHFRHNGQQAYLVGGSVRNLLLHEPCTDWDIATGGDAPKLARRLANALGGFYAHMHDKASRVIVKHEQQEMTIDVSPISGTSIEADLHERDFTLNALAVPLDNMIQHLTSGDPLALVDPLHGTDDLVAHLLRAVNDTIFQHDPIRTLRAVRLMARYQLTIEPHTAEMLARDASLLKQAAPERVHDELYAILRPDGATGRLRFLINMAFLPRSSRNLFLLAACASPLCITGMCWNIRWKRSARLSF